MDFFTQVISFLSTIFDLLINVLTALVTLIVQIPRWVSFTTGLCAFLPSVLLSFAVFSVLISVILFLVGRN